MFFYSEEIPTIIVPLHLTSSFNSLSFPSTCIGTSSLLSVYVSAAQLSGSTVEIVSVGDDSDQFDQTPLSFALTGGVTNQIIDITFTPTSWGLKTATVILSASNGSVINVSLQGMAAAVPLVLTSSVSSLSFGTTTVNTTSSMNVTVSAGGFASVTETVTLSDSSNQFSFSPASFELTGSGTSKTFYVNYSPTMAGTVTGTLTLSSSGGNTKLISLSGSGQAPAQTDIYSASVSLLLKGEDYSFDINGNTNYFVDSSANYVNITRYGNVTRTSNSFKYGAYSMYFDGSGDYLSAPASSNYNFGSGNFTVEMWINPGSGLANGTQKYLFGNRTSISVYRSILSFMSYNAAQAKYNLSFYSSTNGIAWNVAYTTPTAVIAANVWTHVAFVRNGHEYSMFINGVKTVMSTVAGTIMSDGSPFVIGSTSTTNPAANGYLGYMDEFRVTKGVARYTATFTPGPL